MAVKPAKKKGAAKKSAAKKAPAKKRKAAKKESPERATFREEVEGSSRYHLEKWAQEVGEALKEVKQAEDSELVDKIMTAFDEGRIAMNDLAPKKGGKKSPKKRQQEDPDDTEIDDLLDDELDGEDGEEEEDDLLDEDGDEDGEEGGEDDIDDLLDEELGDDEGDGEEGGEEPDEEPEIEEDDEGMSAIEDKLNDLISRTTKVADRLDKMSKQQTLAIQAVIQVSDTVKEAYAFAQVFGKTMLKVLKVKETVYGKIVRKAKLIAKKGEQEDE